MTDVPGRGGGRTSAPLRWAVVGASGFVGSGIVRELDARGHHVIEVAAPRLVFAADATSSDAVAALEDSPDLVAFAARLSGVDVVVNAAGIADAGAASSPALFGANGLLPLWVASAADSAGVDRMIQISSASVQGRAAVIDERPVFAPFSPYSRSKVQGEELLLGARLTHTEIVVVRATSVQGPDREATRRLQRVARSWLASVARPGDRPTVVSSIDALAQFMADVGSQPAASVPPIVLQPWEGLTTRDVLLAAGDRAPRMIPRIVCRALLGAGYLIGKVSPRVRGTVRRVELMWMGQAQDAAWAASKGLTITPRVTAILRGDPRDPLEGSRA